MDSKVIGQRLVALRQKSGKTQREVAELIGITQPCYCMYETGERIPSDEVKIKIAKLYKRTVQTIFFS